MTRAGLVDIEDLSLATKTNATAKVNALEDSDSGVKDVLTKIYSSLKKLFDFVAKCALDDENSSKSGETLKSNASSTDESSSKKKKEKKKLEAKPVKKEEESEEEDDN